MHRLELHRRSRFVLLTALLVPFALPPSMYAGYIYNPDNGHYYGLTTGGNNGRQTWTQAEAEAVALGGHLASITSQSEQTFLINNFVIPTTLGGERQPFWIGLTEVNHSPNLRNRRFRWTTGEPFSFSAWNPGEPNNHTGDEWYTAFNFHYGVNQSITKGTWNDTTDQGSVNGPYRGIIELTSDPAAVPEPGTLALLATGVAGLIGYRLRRSTKHPAAR